MALGKQSGRSKRLGECIHSVQIRMNFEEHDGLGRDLINQEIEADKKMFHSLMGTRVVRSQGDKTGVVHVNGSR